VEAYVSQSARLPAYRRVLAREGAQRPSDVALVGDEAQLARRLGDLAEIGVTDFHAVVVPVEGDPDAYQRTLESLAALAADQSSDARSRETELMQ
jgi:alkanesulfonate monooxygenase SsuD/methylene tetrahydromethanopterin reductase-like flavin-dependent oxidoreductase (luciferase family)